MDEEWRECLAQLDAALVPIATRPVDLSDPRWLQTWGGGPHPLDEAGVRERAESLLTHLISLYRAGNENDRCQIRELLRRFKAYAWAATVPLKAESEEGLIAHLVHFSMRDQGDDPRDAKLELASLLRRARDAGIDVRPSLKEAARLSSVEDRYSWGSTRDWLLRAAKDK